VALINRLRDAGEGLPGCAWLVSPWTDLTMSGETLATKDAVDPIIHKGYLGELANAYLPAGTDRKEPQVSPLYADLKGLPPTLIQVCRDAARRRHTLRRRSGLPLPLPACGQCLAEVALTSAGRDPRLQACNPGHAWRVSLARPDTRTPISRDA
jgi:acetyl esterase/lipase